MPRMPATLTSMICHRWVNGVGIPEGKLSSIFDPFTQVDGSYTRGFGGLGIGFSIANRIMQMMGGAIHVERGGPDGGSKFSF